MSQKMQIVWEHLNLGGPSDRGGIAKKQDQLRLEPIMRGKVDELLRSTPEGAHAAAVELWSSLKRPDC